MLVRQAVHSNLKELWTMKDTPCFVGKTGTHTEREVLSDRMKPICFVFKLYLIRRETVAYKSLSGAENYHCFHNALAMHSLNTAALRHCSTWEMPGVQLISFHHAN